MWTESFLRPLPFVRVCLIQMDDKTDKQAVDALELLADDAFLSAYDRASLLRMQEGAGAVLGLCRLLRQEDPGRPLQGALSRRLSGAPFLTNGMGYCSLTHDRPFCGAALAPMPVGIDLLRRNRRSALRPLSRYVDCGALESLPEAEREGQAKKLWTQLEAYGKLLGVGLSIPKDRLPVLSCTEEGCNLQVPGVTFGSEQSEAWVLSAAVQA